MLRTLTILVVAFQFGLAAIASAQTPSGGAAPLASSAPNGDATDPFLWLEEVNGARATEWVRAENAKTLGVLQSDPRFAGLYADAIKIGEAKDRIPDPQIIGGQVYNFWRDATHVRGIWRTTSLGDYARPQPAWKTVFDLDLIAKTEGKNWVWKGRNCDSPRRVRCLIELSDGGEDAVSVREFDRVRGEAVPNGFALPRGKQRVAWDGSDALLVSREWEPGQLTASGYPFVIKRLQRGRPLSSATTVFAGAKNDVQASLSTLMDGRGNRATVIQRSLTFFETEWYLLTASGPRKLNVPLKSGVEDLVAGRLVIRLDENWTASGATNPAGSLVSVDLAAAMRDPANLSPTSIFRPGPTETLEDLAFTRDHLIVSSLDNVQGRAFVYTPVARGGWSKRQLRLPEAVAVTLGRTDRDGTAAFVYVESFLTPKTLFLADTVSGALTREKTTGPQFDASADVTEQRFATSKDGTRIPYFIVHPKRMKLDGSNPTIINAYGGFAASSTPVYSGTLGKLWLERGGVFVLANIRGGGEFGPAWHEAGLKTHRQVIYDDFAAVGQDLIATGVTSPDHMGIQGGSNGGLLVGVEFTQHPELWNAVEIAVPLLDMLRYEKIEAGASWVAEYGSVSVPAERAFLASISPYNNIKAGVKYPEPFIWTTTKDDRVGPQHARKFAAKLASMGIPYLFYEVTEGGHGSGANIREQALTTALSMTYFTRKLMI